MSETQTKQKKKGGPRNKIERLKMLFEVRRLSIEKGYSAIKISAMLKINRNTVNSYIDYWYTELAKQWKGRGIGGMISKQIERLESQRVRIEQALEVQTSFNERQKLEKMLFDLDNKLFDIYYKIGLPRRTRFSTLIDSESKTDEEKEKSYSDFLSKLNLV